MEPGIKKLINPERNFEMVLVVDCSNSMGVSDAVYADFSYGYRKSTRRKDICKTFFRRVDDTNKQGVVLFNNYGSVQAKAQDAYNTIKEHMESFLYYFHKLSPW